MADMQKIPGLPGINSGMVKGEKADSLRIVAGAGRLGTFTSNLKQ